jgi:hypothetical protein
MFDHRSFKSRSIRNLLPLLAIPILFFLISHYPSLIAPRIKEIKFFAGEGQDLVRWKRIGPFWDTCAGKGWVLGISRPEKEEVLNASDTAVLIPGSGSYVLYGEPAEIGKNPKIEVRFAGGVKTEAIFEVKGTPGSGLAWVRKDGNSRFSMGWAKGLSDKVGTGDSLNPSGKDDLCLLLHVSPPQMSVFFLGALSVFQMVFLPGFLILAFLKMNDGFLRTWVLSFALSLLVNHVLVTAMVLLGIYQRNSLLWLIALEIAILLYWLWPRLGAPIGSGHGGDWTRLREWIHEARGTGIVEAGLRGLFFLGALIAIGYYLYKFVEMVGTGLNSWDAIVSYNRWAVDWFNNRLPTRTWHYPQLLPSTWSLNYVLMGNHDLTYFVNGVMAIFPLTILLTGLDLALRTRRSGYLLGVALTGYLLETVNPGGLCEPGQVDIPVAFMGLCPVYLLLTERAAKDWRTSQKGLMLGAVLAAAAALTKQAGLYICLIYPLLAYLIVLRPNKTVRRRKRARALLLVVAATIVFTVPWYVYKEIQIQRGGDNSEIAILTGFGNNSIHGDRDLAARFIAGIEMVKARFSGALPSLVFVAVVLAGLLDRTWRWILLIVVLPYFMLWALFWSYDIRNISLCLPFAGIAAGMGIGFLASARERVLTTTEKIDGKAWVLFLLILILGGIFLGMDNPVYLFLLTIGMAMAVQVFWSRKTQIWAAARRTVNLGNALSFVLLLLMLFTFLYGSHLDRDHMAEQQNLELRKNAGDRWLNQMIYSYYREEGIQGKILTDYPFLQYLPYVSEFYIGTSFKVPVKNETMARKIADTGARYLLLRDLEASHSSVKEFVNAGIKDGSLIHIRPEENKWYCFLAVNQQKLGCLGPETSM